jgi:uncharacterized membrane protein
MIGNIIEVVQLIAKGVWIIFLGCLCMGAFVGFLYLCSIFLKTALTILFLVLALFVGAMAEESKKDKTK